MLHATSSVPCEQRFLFCIPLLASTKSLTSLVCREVGLFFLSREKTSQLRD